MRFRFPLSASYYAEQIFDAGYAYTDGEREARNAKELQEIFVGHGANEVYARIGTSRHKPALYDDDTSLDAGVARARLAADLGLPFNPLLFLSRNYGDMTGQPHPVFDGYPELSLDRPWEALTIDEMADHLRRFAAIAAAAIVETGARVSVWNLGNEVDMGIAGVTPQPIEMGQWDEVDGVADWYRGPDAIDPEIGRTSVEALFELSHDERIAWLSEHVWPHEARLLAAAAEGVRSADPDAKFATHIGNQPPARGWATAFFRAMKRGGYRIDQPGISMYPTINPASDEDFANMKEEIRALQDEFGVPVMINEFGYPAGPTDETFGDWKHALEGYPLTEDGQARMFEDVVAWGLSEGIAGINPWAPDLVMPVWVQMTFFRIEGTVAIARPIMNAFERALERAGSGRA